MAKSGGDDIWQKLLGLGAIVGGIMLLDYALGGRRKENDAALVPNRIEDPIDNAVAELDRRFTKQWVDKSLDFIMKSVQETLPLPIVFAVYGAELMSKNSLWPMSGADKKTEALRRLNHHW